MNGSKKSFPKSKAVPLKRSAAAWIWRAKDIVAKLDRVTNFDGALLEIDSDLVDHLRTKASQNLTTPHALAIGILRDGKGLTNPSERKHPEVSENLDQGLLRIDAEMAELFRKSAKRSGCSPREVAMAILRTTLHKEIMDAMADVGPNSIPLLDAGYDIHTIHPDFIPGRGEVEEFDLLISPCGGFFFKSWNIIEKRDGDKWLPCPEPFGDFSEKRRRHFLEPITREEAFHLVRENLVPEEFRANFIQEDQPAPAFLSHAKMHQSGAHNIQIFLHLHS